ncbi:MAG TPA: response regulator [Verrucomicrobiae bacterium]|nr:response regulator [Verrucomicrobiae bacterium]
MSAASVKPKILVVTEQTSVLIQLLNRLTRAGCEVTGARNGTDGIKLIQDEKFDLIVLGVDLPDTSGLELFQQLRENSHLHFTPIVFISNRSNENDWRRGLELGAADYIEKPLQGTAFVRRILSHLKTNPKRRAGHG